MICPSAITLSGAPTGTGHVNVHAADRRLSPGGQRGRRPGRERLRREALARAVEVGRGRVGVVADPGVVVGGGERGERRAHRRRAVPDRHRPDVHRGRAARIGQDRQRHRLHGLVGLERHRREVDAHRVGAERVALEVPARRGGGDLVSDRGRVREPIGHVEVERLARAVGVVDRDGAAGGAVLARAQEPEVGAPAREVDGLARGDRVVARACGDIRPREGRLTDRDLGVRA